MIISEHSMTKTVLLRGAAAVSLLAVASTGFAQTTTLPSQVDEIVITADRRPEQLKQVAASVSVVSAAEIHDTPAQGLDDILRLVPGMTLDMIGPDVGHPTAYNEGMRGLPTTETRMLVLMDGVPVNDPFFGYIQWNRVPLDNIAQVEVVRGGGSPLWGNAAMGGVVNVITAAPTSSQFDADVAGGSYGTYRASAYGAYRVSDKFALGLNTAVSGTDGYQTTPPSWTSYGTTTLRSPLYVPTSFRAQNLSLRGDFTPTSDLTGSVVVDYHNNDQVLSTSIGDDHQTTWTYSGDIKKTFAGGGSLTATAFHDDSNFVTNNPHLLSFTTQYNSNVHRTPVDDTGGSLVWSQDLSGIVRNYTLGVDAHYVDGHDYADYYLSSGQLAVPTIVGGGKQLFVGGFAQARIVPVDPLEIVASLRYQLYRSFDGVDTFPPAVGAIPASNTYSTDPRVNVRYALTQHWALRGAYYQSFRAPTLDQLYRTYADTTAGIYEGSPSLRPETLQGGEVGLDYTAPGFRGQLTVYDTTVTNLITQRTLTATESPTALGVVCGYDPATYTYLTCTRNINAASAVARGIELEAEWRLGHGVSAGVAYTYADSHYTGDPQDPTAVGERLEGVPMHNISGRVSYEAPAGWRVETDLRYVSASYGDAHPNDGLIQNAHFVVDASASCPVTHSLQAYVQIQNLLNRQYIGNNGGGVPILGTPFEVMGGFKLALR